MRRRYSLPRAINGTVLGSGWCLPAYSFGAEVRLSSTVADIFQNPDGNFNRAFMGHAGLYHLLCHIKGQKIDSVRPVFVVIHRLVGYFYVQQGNSPLQTRHPLRINGQMLGGGIHAVGTKQVIAGTVSQPVEQ
jgi:hypothetical protein